MCMRMKYERFVFCPAVFGIWTREDRGAAPRPNRGRTGIPMSHRNVEVNGFRRFLIFLRFFASSEKRVASTIMNGPARSLNPHPHSDVRRRPRPDRGRAPSSCRVLVS